MWSTAVSARRLLAGLALCAFVAVVGCSGEPAAIEAGEGQLPRSVPPDFPIPEDAVIGPTMVDHTENRTEVTLDVPWDTTALVRFYTIELVSGGFIVSRSEQRDNGWQISFNRSDLVGTIVMSQTADTSRAVVTLNRS